MFRNKEKILNEYQKCLLINEQYKTIAGIINFHQSYLTNCKILPQDYWEAIIAFYQKELANPNLNESDKETYHLLYQELLACKDSYQQYYFNLLKLQKLSKKLTDEEKKFVQDKLAVNQEALINNNSKKI